MDEHDQRPPRSFPTHLPSRTILAPGIGRVMQAAAEDEAAQARLNAALRSPKLDTTALNAAIKRMGDSLREMGRQLGEVMRTALEPLVKFVRRLHEQANDPVNVARAEARFYVRAGLAPWDPAADPRLVQRILAGDALEDFQLALMTPENRRIVAVAAIRGEASIDTRGGVQ